MSKNKKMFEVEENESIAQCLDRMKQEGYSPVRRMEKPVFNEEKKNGKVEYVPARQQIIFEGRKNV
ncbi:NETI motif-containing protein [Rossellomorea aquimaris]|uniref:NETI motif-containing protein n=1 Tax=Rossellomorea aquimaris TaxID=189382 RepID=A0A5D4TBE7_9BACI|nr:NETI motif-containing protein [Rossellomorea aquimaris]TYS72038.1 NETI motif-containing protein [Rossellomorea aquimaris]